MGTRSKLSVALPPFSEKVKCELIKIIKKVGSERNEDWPYSLDWPRITYTELCDVLNSKMLPHYLAGPLGKVSRFCREAADTDALITTIVISQKSELPGPGYYKGFFKDEKNQKKRQEIFHRELDRVIHDEKLKTL